MSLKIGLYRTDLEQCIVPKALELVLVYFAVCQVVVVCYLSVCLLSVDLLCQVAVMVAVCQVGC